jgi:hypothetical protein
MAKSFAVLVVLVGLPIIAGNAVSLGQEKPKGFVVLYWVRDAKDNPQQSRTVYATQDVAKEVARSLLQYHRVEKAEVAAAANATRPIAKETAPSVKGKSFLRKGILETSNSIWDFRDNGTVYDRINEEIVFNWKQIDCTLFVINRRNEKDHVIYRWTGERWERPGTGDLFSLTPRK